MEVVTESRRHCRNEDTDLLSWSEAVLVDELSGEGEELGVKCLITRQGLEGVMLQCILEKCRELLYGNRGWGLDVFWNNAHDLRLESGERSSRPSERLPLLPG